MDKIKNLVALVTALFSLLSAFTQCTTEKLNKSVYDENFYCEIIDENNIAIGDLITYPESGVVFFPEQIKGYTVSKLGFPSGMGFGGNGYFTSSSNGENGTIIKRCYFPHTIKKVKSDYMTLSGHNPLKIFYCGEVTDLGGFYVSRVDNEIYVPAEKYELFKNALTTKDLGESLLKANVSYHLNYDEDNYYYVDYYESGEKILYIPPIPQRDGYTFGGWFKEAECINQWNFDTGTVQISEDIQEIKLYAKWIAEQ